MQEDYQFLDLEGERIFAALHQPTHPPSGAIVMCHPLGEEKLWSHRVFVSFARELAATGFAVLRFDFRGEGDSARSFEETELESRISDCNLAVDAIRRMIPQVTEVTLLGLRAGAAVAAAVAARRSDIFRLVLWDPVIDGAAYMQTVLRLNLMSQMALHRKVIENREALVQRLSLGETVNIEGYEMSEPLFRQLSEFKLGYALERFPNQALIVQVNQGGVEARPEFSALAASNARCHLEIVQEEPFWKEIRTFYQRAPELTRVTRSFLGIGP